MCGSKDSKDVVRIQSAECAVSGRVSTTTIYFPQVSPVGTLSLPLVHWPQLSVLQRGADSV